MDIFEDADLELVTLVIIILEMVMPHAFRSLTQGIRNNTQGEPLVRL